MNTVEEIIAAIDQLPVAERARLDDLLDRQEEAWDRRIENDAKAGKMANRLEKVDANIASNNLRAFP